MHDFLKGIIETTEREFGPLPQLTPEQLRQAAKMITEQAKTARPIVTSCPHLEIYRDEKFGAFRCCNCQQRVYPDPEGLKWGFLEYGKPSEPGSTT